MKLEIASLRLVGCGPFDDVTLNFCGPDGKPKKTILLAGANGSGKTTVLEAIYGVFETMHNYPNYKGILNRAKYVQANIYYDDFYFSYYFGDKPADAIFLPDRIGRMTGEALEKEGDIFDKAIGLMSDDSENSWTKLRKTETVLKSIRVLEKSEKLDRSEYPPSVLYFSIPRELQSVSNRYISVENYKYSRSWKNSPHSEFPGSLDSYLIWLEYSDTDEYNRVITFLNNLNLDGKNFGISRKELQAVVIFEDASHPLSHLSAGEQNVILILLELHRRLTKGSLVVIDEIELSLHPAYQFLLVQSLKKMQDEWDFQLIFTSHSVDVLNAIGHGKTLFLTDFKNLFGEN